MIVGSQEARLRLARFARMLPHLVANRAESLTRADLRYTNGFALVWAEPAAPDAAGHVGAAATAERIAAVSNHESRITNHGLS